MDEESSRKSTLLTVWDTYRFSLPMGLKNSGQSFQKMVEHVLRGISDISIYINDLLIWTKGPAEYRSKVWEVLQRLAKAGLVITKNKCTFQQHCIDFLGYTVNRRGIRPIKKIVEVISNFRLLAKPKLLLRFLGACNFYRICLPNLRKWSPLEVLQPLYHTGTAKELGVKFADIPTFDNLKKSFGLLTTCRRASTMQCSC